MKRIPSVAILLFILPVGLHAQTAPDSAELTKLLNDFLAGASRNDAAMHDRFWAEDLIYTGSSGRRIAKPDIMRGLRSNPDPRPAEPRTSYSAEDVRIQQYGSTAIVAFRLVATAQNDGAIDVSSYLNTGTFLKRDGKWQVISWQATKMPRPAEQARKDVAEAEAAFHLAILGGNTKKLESLVDDTFVWTHHTGEQVTGQQLIDQLKSGKLKYSKL